MYYSFSLGFRVIILGMRKSVKILTATVCSAAIIAGAGLCTYLYALPAVVSSSWLNKLATKETNKFLGSELTLKNPKLVTGLNSNIAFSIEELSLKQGENELLELKNLDTEFSFREIFLKRLIVKKLLAESIYVNASDLISILPKTEAKE